MKSIRNLLLILTLVIPATGFAQFTEVGPLGVTGQPIIVAVAADGSSIFFLGVGSVTGFSIYEMESDGNVLEIVNAPTALFSSIHMSFDSSLLVFAVDEDLLLEGTTNSNVYSLVTGGGNNPVRLSGLNTDAESPTIIDDNSLVYLLEDDELYSVAPNGTGRTAIAMPAGITDMDTLRASGDGSKLVFSSRDDYLGGNPSSREHLYTIDSDGTNLALLTTQDRDHREAKITEDGQRVVYMDNETPVAQVYSVASDGTGTTQITQLTEPSPDLPITIYRGLAPRGGLVLFTVSEDLVGANAGKLPTAYTVGQTGGLVRQEVPEGIQVLTVGMSPTSALIAFTTTDQLPGLPAPIEETMYTVGAGTGVSGSGGGGGGDYIYADCPQCLGGNTDGGGAFFYLLLLLIPVAGQRWRRSN